MVECPKFILRRHIPWRKLIILLLIILRFIKFVIFCAYIDSFQKSNFYKSEQIPTIILILYILVNWRFLLIAGIISLYLIVIFCEARDDKKNKKKKKTKEESENEIKSLIKLMWKFFWGYVDMPCCSCLKITVYLLPLVKDVFFIILVIVLGAIQVDYFNRNNINFSKESIVTYFVSLIIIYLINLSIIIRRIIQARKIPRSLWDIFVCYEHYSKRFVKMYYQTKEQHDKRSQTCKKGFQCQSLDLEHWIFCHEQNQFMKFNLNKYAPFVKPKEIKKLVKEIKKDTKKNALNSNEIDNEIDKKLLSNNVIVACHQTDISAAKAILNSYFFPSEKGMIGKGIYFATNKFATDFKSNSPGLVYIYAKIFIGKFLPVKRKINPGIEWENEYNSIYYFDEGGDTPFRDEIVLQSSDQIIEYSIVVVKEKADEFRLSKNFIFGCFEQSVHPA